MDFVSSIESRQKLAASSFFAAWDSSHVTYVTRNCHFSHWIWVSTKHCISVWRHMRYREKWLRFSIFLVFNQVDNWRHHVFVLYTLRLKRLIYSMCMCVCVFVGSAFIAWIQLMTGITIHGKWISLTLCVCVWLWLRSLIINWPLWKFKGLSHTHFRIELLLSIYFTAQTWRLYVENKFKANKSDR